MTDCYSAGVVEGYYALSGFCGTTPDSTYTRCYSTVQVGLSSQPKYEGGFYSNITSPPSGRHDASATDCYAAGEVGNQDIDMTNPLTVGGFVSSTLNMGTYTNCYYDKQTTAMREWAAGDASSISGVTGVLTTDTIKSGTGLTSTPGSIGFTGFTDNNKWEFSSGRYPQLGVFANADPDVWGSVDTADLVKAYSEASVSTVFCNTFEQNYNKTESLPGTTYDTVRDLTQQVPMTQGSDTVWEKTSMSGIPAENTSSIYGKSPYVCDLLKNGDQYTAADFAPGIQWLAVKVTINGQVGQRNLRLIPTANLSVGESKTVEVNSEYNHAADVYMAYSTGPRMAAAAVSDPPVTDITQGVFPDAIPSDGSDSRYTLQGLPLPSTYQSAFEAADNQYRDVNVGQMNLNQTHSAQDIPMNNATYTANGANNEPGGVMEVTSTNIGGSELGDGGPYDDKFNGLTKFEATDAGSYILTYNWVLKDGRYLTGSKNITVQGLQTPLGDELKFTGYDMSDNVNGNTGMKDAGSGYTGNIYLNGYIWYTPYGSSVVMKQDAITGQITGIPLTNMTNSTVNSSGTTAGKYCGAPVYVGGYLWFAPFQSDRLLRLDPTDGSMVGFSLANGVDGNTNMTDAASTGGGKYTNIIFDGTYLWLIPVDSDRLVRIDITNMSTLGYPTMTGYAIGTAGTNNITNQSGGTTILKYESAVYDPVNKAIWMIPYNSDRVVRVSDLSNLVAGPTFTGYDITGLAGMTSACADTALQKFYGGVYMDGSVWMTPFCADRVVKISNLDGTPSFQGYDMSDGVGGNIGMNGIASDSTTAKAMFAVSDSKYIWMAAYSSNRLVRLDPSNGQIIGYTIPLYKSMKDDVPYSNPADTTDFHNFFNNNNWGMTEASSSGAENMFCGICFDGNNLWLSPYCSDRTVKISPSVDEAVTASVTATGAAISADLTNYMIQDNPYTGMTPTINKIEWLRVDMAKADTPNLTYKGNTLSPYIDGNNPASQPQAGNPNNFTADTTLYFDAAYALASTVDKGVVYANDYGSQEEQTLSFTAPANGTYYIKAYFTDPVNYYGNDPVYNLERGTPQMVTVIKEVTVKLTGILHIRQIISSAPTDGLEIPQTGYMQLYNVDPSATDKLLSTINVSTTSGGNAASLGYSDYKLPVTGLSNSGYAIKDIIPQYYAYIGYSMTSSTGDLPQGQTPSETDTGKKILADFSSADEIWVTVYLNPMDSPVNNETDQVTNKFSSAFSAILTDIFVNPSAPSTGDWISKAVSAKNTAETDAFVRIQLTSVVVASDGTLLPSELNPLSNILTADFNIYDPTTGNGDWMYGNDGYWYYIGILKPGQTANNLFNHIIIETSDPAYNNASLTVEVKCEASGTEPDSYRYSFWGNKAAPTDEPLKTIDGIYAGTP